MVLPSPAAREISAVRHAALLDAAIAVFARFGYRKASMDEVARAAGVSRQGLYLTFSNKEELFRKAVVHSLNAQLSAASTALAQREVGLEKRLVDACVAWSGRYVGSLGVDATDLMCASSSLAGAALADYEGRFESAIALSIEGSALARSCRAAGLEPLDFARALHATARGLKQSSKTRTEFVTGMTIAARMFCAPLHTHLDQELKS